MTVRIGRRLVGSGQPTFVIAEISANHHHDLDRALRLVDAAADSGADAVKLQTFTADSMTLDVNRPDFRITGGTAWDGDTLHRLYGEASMPWEWHDALFERAAQRGIEAFSSPFDADAVAFLEARDVPAHKIASFELVDTGLLRTVARTGRPVILSTGMATLDEVDEAVATLDAERSGPVVLLKCVSSYPAPAEEMNLRAVRTLRERYGRPSGLSDHTLGTSMAMTAVALGADLIEKHLTLDRREGGPDSGFSLEPPEFREMVASVRVVELALGDGAIGPAPSELPSRPYRRSLYACRDIAAGEPITTDNVRSIRPGHGLAPKHLDAVLGRSALRDIERGEPLSFDQLS